MTAQAAYWLLPAVIPLALYISWNDMRTMKITNNSMLVLFGAFVVLGPFAFGFPTYFWQLLHGPVVLVVGMAIWALRLVGGGDAKMLAAMAPYFWLDDLRLILIVFVAASLGALITHSIFRFTPLHKLTPDWASWSAGKGNLRGGILGLNLAFPKGTALSLTLVVYLLLVAIYR
ncbi:MAG: prepilin peptidase [Pseudomonadota bacterium]